MKINILSAMCLIVVFMTSLHAKADTLKDDIRPDEINFINQSLPKVLSETGKILDANSLNSRPSKLFAAAHAVGRLWHGLNDPTGIFWRPAYSDVRVIEFDAQDNQGILLHAWTYVWAIHPMVASDLAIQKLRDSHIFSGNSIMRSSSEFSILPEVIFVLDGRIRFKTK